MAEASPFNAACPVCGEPVVAFPTTMKGGMLTGPMFSPRTTEELRAACSVHGRSPFNDATLVALGRGDEVPRDRSGERSARKFLIGFTAFWVLIAAVTIWLLIAARS